MRISNEWIRILLALGMYLSCAMLAMSIVFICIEFKKLGYIPTRFYIIVPICLLILSLFAYFSEEKAWKTILKLSLYTLMLVSLIIGLAALRVVLNILLGEPSGFNLCQGIFALVSGFSLFWALLKISELKWAK